MVDAISSINLATKTYLQKKKDEDIAWERLTPSQIIQYMNDGEDVPEEIMRWAEDVSKLEDAPDDVTYESVNGATTLEEINNINSQSDEPDAEDAAAKTSMTQAQAFRESMEASGETKYQQGKTLSKMSSGYVIQEKAMEISLENSADEAETISTVAEIKAEMTERRTSSMKQELDNLIAKAQSKDKSLTPADLNRIAELGGILNALGTQAQADLADIGAELSALEAEVQQFTTLPPEAADFGTEAVAVGAELVTDDTAQQAQINEAASNTDGINTAKITMNMAKYKIFSTLFDRNYRMGLEAIKNGSNAIDAGASGTAALDTAQSGIDTQFTRIEGAQATVENGTGVGGFDIPRTAAQQDNQNAQDANSDSTTSANNDQTASNDENKKSEEIKISSDKTGETDVKDSTLVVDSDELRKRREEKGLA